MFLPIPFPGAMETFLNLPVAAIEMPTGKT